MIIPEGMAPLTQCPIYGMHMRAAKLIKHHRTDRCNRETEMQLWMRDVEKSQGEGEMHFSLYGMEDYPLIEGATQFKYLDIMTEKTNSN